MPNEITVQFHLSAKNGNLELSYPAAMQIDQTTARGGLPGMQVIGTAHELIDFGDLVTPGLLFMKNLDDTNYVEFGIIFAPNFYAVGQVSPGEIAFFRLADGVGFYMKADTAPCAVQISALDT